MVINIYLPFMLGTKIKNLRRTFLLGLLFTCFLLNPALYARTYTDGHANTPTSVQITSPKTALDIGEPLILKLTYKFEEPQMNAETNDIYSSIRHSSCPLIELRDADNYWLINFPDFIFFEKEGVKYYPLEFEPFGLLHVKDEDGLEYSGYFIILYNQHKKGLVFDRPGRYGICTISTADRIFSNVIDLQITSQMQEEKCALLDPNVCEFLMGIDRAAFKDTNYRSKIMVNLKNIVERCPNSLWSKLAAAQVGLESLRDDERERTEARREKREPSRPLYQEAKVYLRMGLDLPDDFSVREKILWTLSEIEGENKNFSQALSYLNELGVKYPKGEYGKRADSAKAEALELQKRQLTQASQSTVRGWSALLTLFLLIAGGIFVVALVLVLVLWLKKKRSSCSK